MVCQDNTSYDYQLWSISSYRPPAKGQGLDYCSLVYWNVLWSATSCLLNYWCSSQLLPWELHVVEIMRFIAGCGWRGSGLGWGRAPQNMHDKSVNLQHTRRLKSSPCWELGHCLRGCPGEPIPLEQWGHHLWENTATGPWPLGNDWLVNKAHNKCWGVMSSASFNEQLKLFSFMWGHCSRQSALVAVWCNKL